MTLFAVAFVHFGDGLELDFIEAENRLSASLKFLELYWSKTLEPDDYERVCVEMQVITTIDELNEYTLNCDSEIFAKPVPIGETTIGTDGSMFEGRPGAL